MALAMLLPDMEGKQWLPGDRLTSLPVNAPSDACVVNVLPTMSPSSLFFFPSPFCCHITSSQPEGLKDHHPDPRCRSLAEPTRNPWIWIMLRLQSPFQARSVRQSLHLLFLLFQA